MNHFVARNGARRMYPTSAQAVAYERAYAAFPATPWGLSEGPAIDGYRDAKSAAALTEANAATAHAAAHPDHRKETTCAA